MLGLTVKAHIDDDLPLFVRSWFWRCGRLFQWLCLGKIPGRIKFIVILLHVCYYHKKEIYKEEKTNTQKRKRNEHIKKLQNSYQQLIPSPEKAYVTTPLNKCIYMYIDTLPYWWVHYLWFPALLPLTVWYCVSQNSWREYWNFHPSEEPSSPVQSNTHIHKWW